MTIGPNGKIANKDGNSRKITAEKVQQKTKNTAQKGADKMRGNTPKKNGEQNVGGRTPKGKMISDVNDDVLKMSPMVRDGVDGAKTSPRMGKKNLSCKKVLYQNGDAQNGHVGNTKEQGVKDDGNVVKGGERRRHPSAGKGNTL